MATLRSWFNATILIDRKVLVAEGSNATATSSAKYLTWQQEKTTLHLAYLNIEIYKTMKKHTQMKVIMLILFHCLTITILLAQPPTQQDSTAKFSGTSAYANGKLLYKLIDAPNHTHCYDVYTDGKLIIHQTSIPAIARNEGFKTKQDTEKVAKLVMDKIRKGEMPPTVSVEEMQRLKVIK